MNEDRRSGRRAGTGRKPPSPLLAACLSFFGLAAGQVYNGEYGKAAAVFAAWVLAGPVYSATLIAADGSVAIQFVLLVSVFVIAAVDAFGTAARQRRGEREISGGGMGAGLATLIAMWVLFFLGRA